MPHKPWLDRSVRSCDSHELWASWSFLVLETKDPGTAGRVSTAVPLGAPGRRDRREWNHRSTQGPTRLRR